MSGENVAVSQPSAWRSTCCIKSTGTGVVPIAHPASRGEDQWKGVATRHTGPSTIGDGCSAQVSCRVSSIISIQSPSVRSSHAGIPG